jgi:hypothetical protein
LSTDWYSKLVLSVVAICLALLVLQGYRADGGAGSQEGRYRLTVVPMARMLLRLDSETGKTWTALFPELRSWTPVADTGVELLDRNAAEAQEVPAPEAPAAESPAPEAEAPGPEEGQSKDSSTP